jgi:hypothetical protein
MANTATAKERDMNSSELVWCEHPEHPRAPHAEQPECQYPHFVGPSGPLPSVGHPLTIHD